MKDKKITIGKLSLNYKHLYKQYNTYNLLILHGWGGKSDSWSEIGEILLNHGYNIIIPDLPGFGKTKIDKIYTLDDYADIIEKFCKKLKLDNIILMGHSNGGAISIKIENRGILDFDRLVLNNSAGIRNDTKRSFKRKVFNKFVKIIKKITKLIPISLENFELCLKIRRFFYRIIGGADYINSEKNPLLKQTYLNMINSDLSYEIKQIKKETLLIWGEKDTFTPISDGNKMKNLITKSKMVVIPECKHSIHLSNPQILINTFLKNI